MTQSSQIKSNTLLKQVRHFGLKQRLMIWGLLIVLLPGVTTYFLFSEASQQHTENRVDRTLYERVGIVAKTLTVTDVEDIHSMTHRLAGLQGIRLTVIDGNGVVQGDSQLSLAEVRAVDNHANRPEILEADRAGAGHATRYSATTEHEMRYFALKTVYDGQDWFVRSSMPITVLADEVVRDRRLLFNFFMTSLFFALLLGGIVAVQLTRRVTWLQKTVRNALVMQNQTDIQIDYRDEFGEMAELVLRLSGRVHRRMEDLERTRDNLWAIQETMEDAVVCLSLEGEIRMVNRGAREILGIWQNAVGQALKETSVPSSVLVLFDEVASGSNIVVEVEIEEPEYKVLVGRGGLTHGGDVVVLIFEDITDLRRLERIRKDFVANVSHELRTPLSVIVANTEALQDGALEEPEVAHSFLSAIVRNGSRMDKLITDLLALSKAENEETELDLMPVELRDFSEKLVAEFDVLMARSGGHIENKIALDIKVMADPSSLERVMLNLIENAIKYSEAPCDVSLYSETSGGKVRIIISDKGRGVPVEHQARLFERFYRVDVGRSRETGGTGLGLSIVKHLVTLMGGRVWVESNIPVGSRFTIELNRSYTQK